MHYKKKEGLITDALFNTNKEKEKRKKIPTIKRNTTVKKEQQKNRRIMNVTEN